MIEIVKAHTYKVRLTYRGKQRNGTFISIESVIAAVAWWMIQAKYEIVRSNALCTCRVNAPGTDCPVHNGKYDRYIKLHERLVGFIDKPLRERIS